MPKFMGNPFVPRQEEIDQLSDLFSQAVGSQPRTPLEEAVEATITLVKISAEAYKAAVENGLPEEVAVNIAMEIVYASLPGGRH